MKFSLETYALPLVLPPGVQGLGCQIPREAPCALTDESTAEWQELTCDWSPERRLQFLTGRWLAREALSRLVPEKNWTQNSVQRNPETREPIWPEGYVGALSHTQDEVVCVVGSSSLYVGLGIDLEPWMRSPLSPRLVERILTPEERTHSALTSPRGLTLAFSAKESFFKAAFPSLRRFIGFQEAALRWNEQGLPVLFFEGTPFPVEVHSNEKRILTFLAWKTAVSFTPPRRA